MFCCVTNAVILLLLTQPMTHCYGPPHVLLLVSIIILVVSISYVIQRIGISNNKEFILVTIFLMMVRKMAVKL